MLPRFALRELWGEVKSGECVWTWDKDDHGGGVGGGHAYGLLSLHLEKMHEGTRWLHVFTIPKSHPPPSPAAGSTQSPTPVYPDPYTSVPETLDPSELASIRETLEKYTQGDLGPADSGIGLGSGKPSLAAGEMDEELDESVGRKVIPLWIRSWGWECCGGWRGLEGG